MPDKYLWVGTDEVLGFFVSNEKPEWLDSTGIWVFSDAAKILSCDVEDDGPISMFFGFLPQDADGYVENKIMCREIHINLSKEIDCRNKKIDIKSENLNAILRLEKWHDEGDRLKSAQDYKISTKDDYYFVTLSWQDKKTKQNMKVCGEGLLLYKAVMDAFDKI